MRNIQLTLPALVILTVSFFCPCFSRAQDVTDAYYWNVASGEYGTASNWRVNGTAPSTAPVNTSEVYIQTGTSTLAVGAASTTVPSGSAADTLTIGGGTDSATALISCDNGSFLSAISSQLNVLNNGTVTLTTTNAANYLLDADLVINGGTVNGDTGRFRIRGTNNQMTSGTIKISTLSIGYNDGVGIASMEISGGTLSTEFLPVGHNQAGKLTISGGEINTGNKNTGSWGISNGAKGEVFINGGTINVKNGNNWKGINIGKDSNAGQVTQTAGSVNADTITFGASADNFYKISGGELNIATSITVPATTTFEMTGGTVTTKSLVLTDKTDFDLGGGNLTITGTTAPAFNIGNSNTTNASTLSLVGGTYDKVISGNTNLTKTGDGTLTLSWKNTYTGATTISGGRIIATNVSALGTGSVTNNSQLEFYLANDASGTYGKALSGEGALFKTGDGTLTLSQKNTFTGDITVSAGTLALTYSVGTNYQRLTGAVTVTGEGSVLSLGGKRTLQQEIAPPSLVTVENGGNITLSAFQYFNNVSLNNGSITRSNGAGIRFGNIAESNIKVTGTEQSSIDEITLVKYQYSPNTTDLTVDVDSDASLLIKGIIDLDEEGGKYKGASVIKTGDGTLTLSGTVNYTGATTVSGGTLALTESANLNNSASITNNGIITATSAQTFNNLTGTGTITAADAVLTLVNPTDTYTGTINGTGEVVINNSTDAAWKGTIDNTVSVTTTGSAALTLSTAQTYTGTTTVNSGSTVNLTNEANLINSSSVVVNGTLNYSGYTGATTQTFNNLTGSGTITGADAVNLELCCNTADVEGVQFSGTINAGSATITKTGTGRLKLYNNDSSNQSLIASTLVVNSGRLDIQGWLNSALTVKNAALFSPGNSIGTTNITGDYTLENSGTLLLELGGIGSFDYDELIVEGDIDFQNGSLIQLVFDGVTPTENGSYGLVTSTGTITYGQTFDWDSILTNAGMSLDNWSLAGTDKTITLSYTKDVVAVPEPSTWALLILGALGMMYFRRKK